MKPSRRLSRFQRSQSLITGNQPETKAGRVIKMVSVMALLFVFSLSIGTLCYTSYYFSDQATELAMSK